MCEVEAIETGILGERERERRFLAVCFSISFEDVQNRLRVRCIALKHFLNGPFELLGTVGPQEVTKLGDVATQGLMAFGQLV